MKALFIYDFLFKKFDGRYYASIFTSSFWYDRYLKHFNELIVICRQKDVDNKSDIGELSISDCENVEFDPIKCDNLFVDGFFHRKIIKTKIRDRINRCDCAIVRLPSVFGNIAIPILKKVKKPYLIELVGCPWDAYWNYSIKGKLLAPFMFMITRRLIKNAPYVVYVTNQFLQERYPTAGKNIDISNVKLNQFDDKILYNRIKKIKEKSDEKIILGTTAAVNVRYKGQQFVIKAIAKLNKQGYNFEYYLVGGGDNSYLKSIAEKYGVLDKINFIGSLPHEKVFEFLDIIDIYIQPSLQEGLPRSVIEAMSRACPVIGSTSGGIPELIDQKYCFKVKNINNICDVLKSMDKNVLLEEAERSLELAKKYDSDLLENRRTEFFKNFINESQVIND